VLAFDATIVLRGPRGRRTVAATDFFISYFQTAMQPNEMLVEIRVPATGATGAHYEKFVRRANDWAIVAVATVGGHVALANMANKPLRATATEQALPAAIHRRGRGTSRRTHRTDQRHARRRQIPRTPRTRAHPPLAARRKRLTHHKQTPPPPPRGKTGLSQYNPSTKGLAVGTGSPPGATNGPVVSG
jgi:molybdopterin-dependent oxidoreductase-like protein